jgi:hypothetical protein
VRPHDRQTLATARAGILPLTTAETRASITAREWPECLHLDLSKIDWNIEVISVEELIEMPTSASDGDYIEDFAANPDHWVRVRNRGIHIGVAQCWETHGTWKRWPILIDRRLLDPPESGLQIVEGRTRVGVLRGRHRQGTLVAERHLAWVGRQPNFGTSGRLT